MDKDQFKLLKSRTGGERIADTFTFIRINLGVLVQTHLLLSFPVILLTAGLFLLMFPADFSLIRTVDSGPFVDSVAVQTETYQWFLQTFFNFAAFMPIAANTLIVLDQYARSEGQPVKFDSVFKSFLRNFPKIYLAKLIMGAIIVVSSFFLLIPAFVFYTMFLCAEMLILQHQYGVFSSFSRSWTIMNKGFGSSFGANAGLFLTFALLWLALRGIGPMYEFLATFFVDEVRSDGIWMILGRSIGIFNAMLGYMLFMIPAAGAGIQYFSLREEIAKTDVMQRIREIGVKEDLNNPNLHPDEQY